MRSIQAFGTKATGRQVLPADAPGFEEVALRACELVAAGDPRIGKVPGRGGRRVPTLARKVTRGPEDRLAQLVYQVPTGSDWRGAVLRIRAGGSGGGAYMGRGRRDGAARTKLASSVRSPKRLKTEHAAFRRAHPLARGYRHAAPREPFLRPARRSPQGTWRKATVIPLYLSAHAYVRESGATSPCT